MSNLTDEEQQVIDIANDLYVARIQADMARRCEPRPEWYLDVSNNHTVIRCRGEYNIPDREIVIRCQGHEQFAARMVSWLNNQSISPEQKA